MQAANEGWYCYGVSLQGARWVHEHSGMKKPEASDPELSPLPVLLLKVVPRSATEDGKGFSSENQQRINLYDTLQRKSVSGTLDLEALSENVVGSAGCVGARHQWMLRVAAFILDSDPSQ